jgi:hypothetical protein
VAIGLAALTPPGRRPGVEPPPGVESSIVEPTRAAAALAADRGPPIAETASALRALAGDGRAPIAGEVAPLAAPTSETPNVFVRVVACDGTPAAACHVDAWIHAAGAPAPGQPVAWSTDAEGLVHARLGPGELRIVAWGQGGISAPVEREIDARGATLVTLELTPGASFAGSVRDRRSGAPIAGASIRLHTYSPLDAAVSAADGSYSHARFPASDEHLQVRVEAPGYGSAVAYLAIEADGSWWAPPATDGERARHGRTLPARLDFELLPALSIRGRLIGPDGAPVTGGSVQAEGYFRVLPTVASRDFGAAAVHAHDGEFEIGGLRADIGHVVLASAPGAAERALEVPASCSAVDLGEIRLEPEALVAGVLIDSTGRPAQGVRLELRALSSAVRASAGAGASALDPGVRVLGALRLASSGSAGEFAFAGLPGGSYSLSARRDSGALAAEAFDLAPGEERAGVVLELAPAALTLRGQVVGPHGPAAGARVEVARYGALGGVLADADGVFQVAGLDADDAYELAATWIDPESGELLAAHRRAFAHEAPRIELGR